MGLLDRLLGNRDNISDREFSEEDLKKMSIEELETLKAELEAELEKLEGEDSKLGAAPKAAAAEPAPDKPIADKPKAEEKKSFFDQSDAEALKGSLAAQKEARDAAKSKEERDRSAIREAMLYAVSCYAEGLRELPKLSEAANVGHVEFKTGFSCSETRTYTHESHRLFKTEHTQEEKSGTAKFYADSSGRIEKRWEAYNMYGNKTTDVSEVTVEEFAEAMKKAVSKTRIPACESSFLNVDPDFDNMLFRLVLKGESRYQDGGWYFVPETYRLIDSLKSWESIAKTVKNMLLGQLGMK